MTLSEHPSRVRWRPYTDQVAALRAIAVLVMSLWRAGRREIWIGDSHAASLVVGPTWAMFLAGPRRELVLRTGARLMYSLGRHGFPARVERFAAWAGRLGRRDSLAPIFVAGEIDVRNALAAHPDTDFAFVDEYVEMASGLAQQMNASTAFVVVPPPPRPRVDIDPSFPSVGTDDERLAAFCRLRAALTSAVAEVPSLVLVDLTDVLADVEGWMRPEFTDDGCHTNAIAHPVIRQALTRCPEFITGQR